MFKPRLVLPRGVKKKADTLHTSLHCIYWTHALANEPWGLMTPVYLGMLVLTMSLHFLVGEKEKGI